MIDRESIYNALLAQLKTSPAFVTVSRKPMSPDQLTPDMQPALMMEEVNEHAEPRPRGLPTKWTLNVDLGVYYYFESEPEVPGQYDPSPSTALNTLILAVETALAPNPCHRRANAGWRCFALLDRGRSGEVTGLSAGPRGRGDPGQDFGDIATEEKP